MKTDGRFTWDTWLANTTMTHIIQLAQYHHYGQHVRCKSTRKETKTKPEKKPCGKTHVKEMWKVGLTEDGVLDRTKWKNNIRNHSGYTI